MALDVMSMFARLGLDKSEYEKGMKEAEGGFKNFGSNLKKGVANVAKIAAGAAAAGATALAGITVALTKSAVSAYGEYEQLVGGVDTLFKGSSKQVQEYAANAYKTAGMSANQYMETVTGFSASLIQSLGGDTKAAADLADQAIRDMSDNANKMGTDISSIQNAYQGFAKGNYTMLDNLKLGYGGTKEEMDRLVKDAMKIDKSFQANTKTVIKNKKQVKELDYNYADVVRAINIVQTNMGITGATAAEAADTIQGSIAATKAAWENVLTSIGTGKGMKEATKNLVASAGNVIRNVKPVIQRALSGIGDLVVNLAPQIIRAIPQLVSGIVPGIMATAGRLSGAITRALPKIWTGVKNYVSQRLFPAVSKLIASALGRGNTSMMGERLSSTFRSVFDKVVSVVEGIGAKMNEYWTKVLKPILGDITEFVLFYVLPLADQVLEAISPALDWLGEKVSAVFDGQAKLWNSVVMPAIMDFFSVVSNVWENVKKQNWGGVGETIWNAIKGGFKVVNGWLLKLVLGDDYKPESGWGDAGAKIWGAIQTGFAVVNGWLLKLVLGDEYTPESGWGDAGAKIWKSIKDGFAVVNGWLLKLVLGDDYKPESGWGDAGAKIWGAIKDGFAVVNGWLLKLVLGDEYTPESGWGDAGAKIWKSIKDGFAVVNGWLLQLVLGDEYSPASGWGDAGAKIWGAIQTGFAVVKGWLLKLVLGDEYTPESGWGDAGAKIWQAIKDGFAITSDWLKKLLLGEDEYTPDATWADVGKKIWDKIIEGLASAVDWLKNLFDDWTTKLTDGSIDFKSIGSTIGSTIWGAIKDAFNTVIDWFKYLFGGESDDDQNSVKGAIYSIDWAGLGTSIFNFIGAAFTGIADTFKGFFESAWDEIKAIDWAGLGDAMWSAIKGAFSTITSWFSETFKAPINTVIGFLNGLISKVRDALNTVIDFINSSLSISIPSVTFDANPFSDTFGVHTDSAHPAWSWNPGIGRINWADNVIPKLARGGIVGNGGEAIVGEYRPEHLRVVNGKAVVTPLNTERFPGGGQEIVVPRNESRQLTVILELDRQQMGKAVYRLNNEETQRVGVRLAKGGAY